jgi:AcrR family transcriptional regulator
MDVETAEARLLEAAEQLFNERGIQAVGMDDIRAASGVSLKRLYQVFPAKERLVEAVLRRRDRDVKEALARHASAHDTPRDRILAVFDYLYLWFSEPDFRGCAFINSFGELGGTSDGVAGIVRQNKRGLTAYLGELVAAAQGPAELADQLAILANGAMATAGILGSPEPARQARAAAGVLLDAAGVRKAARV